MAPKVTSSSNRNKRSTNKPVTKGQNPQRANRQSVSQAKVTTSQQRSNRQRTSTARVTTAGGRSTSPGGANAPANARPVVRNAASNVASARMRGVLRTAAAGRTAANVAKVASIAKGASPATVAYETLKARPTAAGTVTAAQGGRAPSRFANARDLAFKKASAIKGSPVVGPRKSTAGQFDSAFAAARKAGKKEFTFKGKRYTTEMK